MNILRETVIFSNWLAGLNDKLGKARILARIQSAKQGNLGDCAPVGEGVSEIRIHFGSGYRVYFAQEGLQIYLLISGGDKSTQRQDIGRAKALWREIKESGA